MITMEQFCSSRGLTHELRQCSQGWIALVHCGGDIPIKIAGGYAAHPKDAVASLCERLEVSPPASLPPFNAAGYCPREYYFSEERPIDKCKYFRNKYNLTVAEIMSLTGLSTDQATYGCPELDSFFERISQ
jgi:hypothetical protein